MRERFRCPGVDSQVRLRILLHRCGHRENMKKAEVSFDTINMTVAQAISVLGWQVEEYERWFLGHLYWHPEKATEDGVNHPPMLHEGPPFCETSSQEASPAQSRHSLLVSRPSTGGKMSHDKEGLQMGAEGAQLVNESSPNTQIQAREIFSGSVRQ